MGTSPERYESMSKLIQLPSDGERASPWDKQQADAFRDLEGPLSDCVRMAGIAARIMSDADDGLDEQSVFAIYHTKDMIEDLLSKYLGGYKAGARMKRLAPIGQEAQRQRLAAHAGG